METLHSALNSLLLLCGDALLAAAVWGAKQLGDYLASKTSNDRAKAIILRLDDVATRAVKEVYQAYVKPAKDAGAWNQLTQAQAKAAALAAIKSHLGQKGIAEILWAIGADNVGTQLDQVLATYVESAVHDTKQQIQIAQDIGGAPAPKAPTAPFPALRVPTANFIQAVSDALPTKPPQPAT